MTRCPQLLWRPSPRRDWYSYASGAPRWSGRHGANCSPGPWRRPRPNCGAGTRRRETSPHTSPGQRLAPWPGCWRWSTRDRRNSSWSTAGTALTAPRPPPPPTRTPRSCCSVTRGSASRAWPWSWPGTSSSQPTQRTGDGSGGSQQATRRPTSKSRPATAGRSCSGTWPASPVTGSFTSCTSRVRPWRSSCSTR